MTSYERKILKRFLKIRNRLINDLDMGKLSKKDFLFENYMLLSRLNMKPFLIPNTIAKCIYNYQYYNILAKHSKSYPDKRSDKDANELADLYYIEKDKTIKWILDNEDLGKIISYPLKLKSKRLNGKLFEIILLDHENLILHSLDDEIKQILIDRGVYLDEPRLSVIDDYVNKGY